MNVCDAFVLNQVLNVLKKKKARRGDGSPYTKPSRSKRKMASRKKK